MHQSLQGATFHIEHVIPVSLGGRGVLSNLVLACPGCNLHKSNRVEVVDPDSGAMVAIFRPPDEPWHIHFRFDGFMIVGQSATGRATADALNFNHPRRIKIRRAEALFGLFPPDLK
jgi:hypothetical protein